jgi:acetolactate synthase I/III small subunit
MEGPANQHLLSVLVENRPGVLTRVAGLFARRGYNIHSLAVAPTADGSVSRISMVVDLRTTPLPQMILQLDKLVNVLAIDELAPSEAIEREVLLATVLRPGSEPGAVDRLVADTAATILDADERAVTLLVVGTPEHLDAAEALLAPFDITASQRSGRVALPALGAPN